MEVGADKAKLHEELVDIEFAVVAVHDLLCDGGRVHEG